MTLALRIVAHSEIGLVRKNNQDSGYASPTLVVVADGMGGAAAGDLASSVAIAELVKADGHYAGEEMLEALAGAVVRANDRMADLIADNHSLDGMGTTVCGALFDGQRLGVVHIGDSRGYLRRDGELERLTHDHSWVQTLVDEGRITEAESLYHPHRSLILKVLNGQPIHEPDLFLVEVQAGDRIMFCSDGLCGLVPDATIDHLLDEPDLNHVLSDLTEAAHAGGGLDNITIIVADVYDADDATATAADTPAPSGATITVPTVVGAAATREIPAVAARPAIQLDAGDDADELPSGHGSSPRGLKWKRRGFMPPRARRRCAPRCRRPRSRRTDTRDSRPSRPPADRRRLRTHGTRSPRDGTRRWGSRRPRPCRSPPRRRHRRGPGRPSPRTRVRCLWGRRGCRAHSARRPEAIRRTGARGAGAARRPHQASVRRRRHWVTGPLRLVFARLATVVITSVPRMMMRESQIGTSPLKPSCLSKP